MYLYSSEVLCENLLIEKKNTFQWTCAAPYGTNTDNYNTYNTYFDDGNYSGNDYSSFGHSNSGIASHRRHPTIGYPNVGYPSVGFPPNRYPTVHYPSVGYPVYQQIQPSNAIPFNGNSQIASPTVGSQPGQVTSGGGVLNGLPIIGSLTQNIPLQQVTKTVSNAVGDVTSQISTVTDVTGQLTKTATNVLSTVQSAARSVTDQIGNVAGTVSGIANSASGTANSALNSATNLIPL